MNKEQALVRLENMANEKVEAVAAVHAAKTAIRNARLQLARAEHDSVMAHAAYQTQFRLCVQNGYIANGYEVKQENEA